MVGTSTISLPRIRVGRRADLDDIYALDQRVFAIDHFPRRSIRNSLMSKNQIVLVAEIDNKLVGTSTMFFHRLVARLYSIAVVPERQCRGIGRLILTTAEKWARHRNAVVMRLEVRDDNDRAISFYRSAGYTAFCRRIHYYRDGNDAIRFEKRL